MEKIKQLFGYGRSLITPTYYINLSGGRTLGSLNAEAALSVPIVFSCYNKLLDILSTLPLNLYDKNGVEYKDKGAGILLYKPNLEQSAQQFHQIMFSHMILYRLAYAEIQSVGNRVIGLIPLDPTGVQYQTNTNTYQVVDAKGNRTLRADQVMVVDLGGTLKSPLDAACDAIRLASSIADLNITMTRSKGAAGALLKIQTSLERSPEVKTLVNNLVEQAMGGNPVTLYGNMELTEGFYKIIQAQVEAMRLSTVEDICRTFGVPAVLVGGKDVSTWGSGIEQLVEGFYKFTLKPYLVRYEAALNATILGDQAYAKFNAANLLRGSYKEMADYLSQLVKAGIITANEARAKFDLLPITGGDVLTRSASNN